MALNVNDITRLSRDNLQANIEDADRLIAKYEEAIKEHPEQAASLQFGFRSIKKHRRRLAERRHDPPSPPKAGIT